jgi:hypothetical protein
MFFQEVIDTKRSHHIIDLVLFLVSFEVSTPLANEPKQKEDHRDKAEVDNEQAQRH